MKVVLFCGGLGMRLRDYAENVPKPMVPLGYRPILWHLMKYYAHFGHRDFVLCLGYRGDMIKNYFLNYEEGFRTTSSSPKADASGSCSPATSRTGGSPSWRPGSAATSASGCCAVKKHLEDEEMFLANYSDGLTDLPLPEQIEAFRKSGAIGCFLSVRPNLSYHFVSVDNAGQVQGFRDIAQSGLRVNGGFFVFRQEIFDYMQEGEELVEQPFNRLVEQQKLLAYEYDGFWMPMDTAKDKQRLDELYATGKPPWYVWKNNGQLHD